MFLQVLFTSFASAGPFDEIVVFGDSLSDDGNLVFFEDQQEPDPSLYYQGRFSNGPVWVEYLSDAQHFDAPLTDLALGGAQSNGLVPPGLIEQVTVFIVDAGAELSQNSLFVIWIGANDYLNGNGDFQSAVDNINEALDQLASFGAMHILILNLPDLGAIPETIGTPEVEQATAFSTNFNTDLEIILNQFSAVHPGVEIYRFDVFSFFNRVQSDPSAFEFVNATDPSPNFAIPDNFDGDDHVFWDDKHPTTAMHALFADQVFMKLSQQIDTSEAIDGSQGIRAESSCFIVSAHP